ncbi:hypothetical protein [Legionella bononiensis]|uniref:Substrate of the Dot/Icm secretion system n=1 Tax=Legionella bononiensis TaxID=2793102 RepID=A0ABS1WCR7_9GAMM|nr:hypothetical protein [Legionella bononiensis]MBL7479020.1 hypothetical protein [Legionella bononiensis]MBL7527153.1 hypothetical protein [Legionella bononiensis]MBL7562122.1 hypothetical protein [Legionella bononiensis]
MSSNEDKIKKNLQAERLKQEALGREIEQIRLEEEKRKNAALLDEESSKSQPVEEMTRFNLQPTGVEADDWKKIVEDFKKKYPNVPIENNVLVFPTKDDAIAFFTTQATQEPPRKFLASELDSNGKPTGFYAFSCGNGTLYQGTLNEIEEQLKSEQENNPDDPNLKQGLATISRLLNPAKGYRETLIQAKDPESTTLNDGHHEGSTPISPQRSKS